MLKPYYNETIIINIIIIGHMPQRNNQRTGIPAGHGLVAGYK